MKSRVPHVRPVRKQLQIEIHILDDFTHHHVNYHHVDTSCVYVHLLPICRPSTANLLPICCQSTAHLLPICCPSTAHLLPICCPSAANLPPICCPSAAHLLPICCQSTAHLPTICCPLHDLLCNLDFDIEKDRLCGPVDFNSSSRLVRRHGMFAKRAGA